MIKKRIVITAPINEYKEVADKIHEQLKGTKDYIESNIVLNYQPHRNDPDIGVIRVFIYDECESIPEIRI